MEAAAAELEKNLTPAKRQQVQNAYTRANQEIKFRVDKALEEPSRAAAYAEIKAEIQKLEEARQDLQADMANNLSAGGEVRRYRQAYRGYQAEVAVLTNGTPAQKTKLVQLYECENETL
ncbi:MAG: hypothetical protein EOP11_25420 [Proteobacteria bacterium]|nr:MAG: hypothetical protein EOP11_25420 [Pseudomonadota bacterium]